MKASREPLLIGLSCVLLFTSALDLPFYTRGEPREGLVVREMLRSGRWLVPERPEGELARKPPLYYWLAAPLLRVLPGSPETALRLPAAALATAAVLATWGTARAVWGPAAGLPAALVLASAFEWTRAAGSARVDMALAAPLAAVLAAWVLALRPGAPAAPRRLAALAAAGVGLGVLAKGPVALALPALAVLAFLLLERDRGALRPLRPLAVLAAGALLGGTWYLLAWRQEGSAFLEVVARENWRRFVDPHADTGHGHSAGYLIALGLVGLLPWTPLAALGLGPLRGEAARPARLAAAWVASGAVFFSLAAAKRSVYLLPLYPALALLVGAGVAAAPRDGAAARVAAAGARLFPPALLLLAALTAALALGADLSRPLRPWLKPADADGAAALAAAAHAAGPVLLLLAAATAAGVPFVGRAARARHWSRLGHAIGAAAVVWTAAFNLLLHPAVARHRTLRDFLARVESAVPPDAPLLTFFPADPGLRFYAARVERRERRDPRGGHLLVWEDEWRRLRDAAGRPLPVVAVSEARQPRRGHLALVLTPPGPLHRAAPAPAAPGPEDPGLRRGS